MRNSTSSVATANSDYSIERASGCARSISTPYSRSSSGVTIALFVFVRAIPSSYKRSTVKNQALHELIAHRFTDNNDLIN